MKPREFWIEISLLSNFVGAEIYRVLTKPQTELQKRTSDGCIHVREVTPIDWERVWAEYWNNQNSHIMVADQKAIQDLVEKSLRGEL